MKKLIALLTLVVTAVGLSAQVTPPPDRPMPHGLGMGLFNQRVDISTLPIELRVLVIQFREQRHAFLEQRKALIEGLKDLTEVERRARIEALKTQNQAALEAQRSLAKQIREQLRTLRDARRSTPGG